ncbi:MAG: phenylalanine--tRNA ligase subunit beta [Candidatus Omnitrophota bacterium]
MKITYSWLKEFVDVTLKPQELADRLTMAGLSVASLENLADDWVFDLEITSNRPDLLSVRGIAREVAAFTGGKLKKPVHSPQSTVHRQTKKKDSSTVTVRIDDKKGCSVYHGTVIRNVRVSPSPPWLKKRIEDLGIRSVNNVVDITNYCLLALGQPLHAFDLDKLGGQAIVVRRARDNEKITLIDGTEKKLNKDILVIADSQKPVAVAGVMGGQATEVTATTKNILLESACFDAVLIRRASRFLGVASDSSYRFERGVDLLTVKEGAEMAARLICELCGAEVVMKTRAGQKTEFQQRRIPIDINKIQDILSIKIAPKQVRQILEKLGFGVKAKTKAVFEITVPSFRRDVALAEDITEEIARVYGYDKIPLTAAAIKPSADNVATLSLLDCIEQTCRNALVSCGLKEAITYSLVSEEDYRKTGMPAAGGALSLENPLNQDYALLRTTLLPSLLGCVALNMNRSQKNLELFEISRVFVSGAERLCLGVALVGAKRNSWQKASRGYSIFDLKGVLETVFEELQIADFALNPQAEDFAQSSTGCRIMVAGKPVGRAGQVAEAVKKAWGIKAKENIFVAELMLEDLANAVNLKKVFKPIASTPSISRDISLLAHKETSYAAIKALIQRQARELLKSVTLVERYQGKEIPKGQTGLTISVEYGCDDKTLTDAEINPVHQKILDRLAAELSVTLR